MFLENPRRCRAPASSVDERSFPARPGTGGTESTRATGKVAAELRVVTRTSMLAGPLRPAASNHPFSHITARTLRIWPYSAVERSEERLNVKACADWTQHFLGMSSGLRDTAASHTTQLTSAWHGWRARSTVVDDECAAWGVACRLGRVQGWRCWRNRMVVRLGGRAGGMPRWSDMCPADSIDTAVLVPKKFRRRENPARRRGRRRATVIGRRAARRARRSEWKGWRGVHVACGVGLVGWARRVLARVLPPVWRTACKQTRSRLFLKVGYRANPSRLDKSSLRSNFASST